MRELRKSYGALEAVKGVSLEIRAGEIFGLIGPDGAGKTSVFQILGGVMPQTSGAAEMYGVSARDARPFVGYLTQTFSLYQDMTRRLRTCTTSASCAGSNARRSKSAGCTTCACSTWRASPTGSRGACSGGMKQKLALACALIAEPKILLLDEPTTGVDPVSRREFWDTLVHLSGQGMTVVVATPYLDEAERCTRVALMFDGQIHQTGTPAEIRRGLGLERLEVHASDLGRAEDVLASVEGIDDVQRFGDRLDLMVKDPARGEELTRAALGAAGLETRNVRHTSPTLENAFVSILRANGGSAATPAVPAAAPVSRARPRAPSPSARALCTNVSARSTPSRT